MYYLFKSYKYILFSIGYVQDLLNSSCILDYYLKQDKRGLILVKTQSMLIVATYTENMFPSVCVEAVEKLGNPP